MKGSSKSVRKEVFRAALILAAFALVRPRPAASEDNLSSLLKLLAENQARMSQLMKNASLTMTTRTEQLDGKGKVESSREIQEKVTYENGREKRELVRSRSLRGGQDETTQERQKRTDRREKKSPSEERSQSLSFDAGFPFSAAEQEKHRFSLLGPDPGDPKRLRIRFEPKERESEKTGSGEAIVDSNAGAPIEVRYRPSRYSKHVKEMEVVMKYGGRATPAGALLSQTSVDVTASLLFLKKYIRTTTTLSEYSIKEGA